MRGHGWVDAAIHAFDELPPDVADRRARPSSSVKAPRSGCRRDTRATLDVYGNLAIELER